MIRERNKLRVSNLLVRVVDILENRAKNINFNTIKNTRKELKKSNREFAIKSKSNKKKEEKNSV